MRIFVSTVKNDDVIAGCSVSPDYVALSNAGSMCVRPPAMRQELQQIRSGLRSNSTALATLRRDLSTCRTRADAERASNLEQGKRLAELGRGLAETQKQVQAQEGQITDINRRMDEQDKKIMELMEDIAQIKQDRKVDSHRASGEGQSEEDRKSRKRKSLPSTGSGSKRSKLSD